MISALRRDHREKEALLRALARLHVSGAGVAWTSLFAGAEANVSLPTYPFQRERYWPAPPAAEAGDAGQ